MASQDIIQNLIFQIGQSQNERLPQELSSHFIDIDERKTENLSHFAQEIAKLINYYRDNPNVPAGNWEHFLNDATIAKQLADSNLGQSNASPHLALFLAFLELYKQPQQIINQITSRHLDFYYQDVLQLNKKEAVSDKVHLLIELKKNVAPVWMKPENLFSAGKDSRNIELIYAPIRDTIINHAKVESLRTLFFDDEGRGTIRSAPIANSIDGLGGKLNEVEPKWFGFGRAVAADSSERLPLPVAKVGFAIASPVLRLHEGTRKINVSVQLKDANTASLGNRLDSAFEVLLTGASGWLGPYVVSPVLGTGNQLTFSFTVPASDLAIVDYDPALHRYSYQTKMPILQVLLRSGNQNLGYNDLKNITVKAASISVEVSGITSLQLESDNGRLDPKKAFMPFGSQASKGSRFFIGYPEAFSKKLSEVTLKIQWKDTPENFTSHYQNYGESSIKNTSFTATVNFQDGGNWVNESPGVQLFNATNASTTQVIKFPPSTESSQPSDFSIAVTQTMQLYALANLKNAWANRKAANIMYNNPFLSAYQSAPSEPKPGFISFLLERDFLQATYRTEYVKNVMEFSKNAGILKILKEPYTPTIQSISLGYKAHSATVNLDSVVLEDFANPDLEFFHISYFGQMREHRYQRQQIEAQIQAGISASVSLIPNYEYAGELLIGLSQLRGGDSVNILFQVAEGSANPDLPSENLTWFVLCDNYWKPLSRSEVLLDTTNQLLASGVIQFIIPSEASTQNTILPRDLIWLKAAISNNPTRRNNVMAVCQLIDVVANAVEVQFVDRGNDPQHLLTALAPGKISKFENGLAPVKLVRQPYASFGGRPVEGDKSFYTRISERLRHKHRAIANWDYERLILEAFPKVHQVKCIPHAKENSWLAPGNVLLVVIPDLKNKRAINLLQPKVDTDTLVRIKNYIQALSGMQVQIHVKNPNYQPIQLDFKVMFYPGNEFNYYRSQLAQAITQFLSPWAYDNDRMISFGGKIYKSVLLDFIEDLPYVDYVTDFKMYTRINGSINYTEDDEVQPNTPDTILVSSPIHNITPVS